VDDDRASSSPDEAAARAAAAWTPDAPTMEELDRGVARWLGARVAADVDAVRAQERTTGERAADWLARHLGSWLFIVLFGGFLAVWIALNVLIFRRHLDPYPFILLNLMLSCLAAIQAPVIMMSQNRQEARDRLRGENDYAVNLKAEVLLEHLTAEIEFIKRALGAAEQRDGGGAELEPQGGNAATGATSDTA
jgi:uncharacterized membrane protein